MGPGCGPRAYLQQKQRPSAHQHPLRPAPPPATGRPPSHSRDLPSKDTGTHLLSPAQTLSPCSCLAPPPAAPRPRGLLPCRCPTLQTSSGLRTFARAEHCPRHLRKPVGFTQRGEETVHLSGPRLAGPEAQLSQRPASPQAESADLQPPLRPTQASALALPMARGVVATASSWALSTPWLLCPHLPRGGWGGGGEHHLPRA